MINILYGLGALVGLFLLILTLGVIGFHLNPFTVEEPGTDLLDKIGFYLIYGLKVFAGLVIITLVVLLLYQFGNVIEMAKHDLNI